MNESYTTEYDTERGWTAVYTYADGPQRYSYGWSVLSLGSGSSVEFKPMEVEGCGSFERAFAQAMSRDERTRPITGAEIELYERISGIYAGIFHAFGMESHGVRECLEHLSHALKSLGFDLDTVPEKLSEARHGYIMDPGVSEVPGTRESFATVLLELCRDMLVLQTRTAGEDWYILTECERHLIRSQSRSESWGMERPQEFESASLNLDELEQKVIDPPELLWQGSEYESQPSPVMVKVPYTRQIWRRVWTTCTGNGSSNHITVDGRQVAIIAHPGDWS